MRHLTKTLLVVLTLLCQPGCDGLTKLRSSNSIKTKSTVACMREIGGLLALAQPEDLSAPSVQAVLDRYDYRKSPVDGWGHPLLVELAGESHGVKQYRVTSLGRDGRRGSCCQRLVDSLDDDAVLEGGDLVQVWSPSAH